MGTMGGSLPGRQEEISQRRSSATARRGWTRRPGNDYRSCRRWYGPSTPEMNQQVLGNLDNIITTLETDSSPEELDAADAS